MRRSSFGELVSTGELAIGDGYRAKNEELGGDGLIFLRAAYLQDDGFRLSSPDRFNERNLPSFGDKVSQIGDTVVTTKGNSLGRTGRISEREAGAIFSPHLSYWRSKDPRTLDPGFLYYWSRSPEFKHQCTAMAHSTDMAPYLSLRDQLRLHVTLPKPEHQRWIARLLGALDDKIELNRRMNETLEALARAIFKSWFVDFDPVRAKAKGRQPFGMKAATAELFPDRFGPDGLPEGWREGPPLQLAKIVSGGTPRTTEPDYWDGNIAWATAKDVSQCSTTFLFETDRSISESGLDNSSAKIVPARSTVVVARGATTGRYCMFGVDLAMNQTCYALRARDGDHYFLFCWFGDLVRQLVHAGHGSVFNTITTRTFETGRALIPTQSVRKAFDETVTPLFETILEQTKQSKTLAALRDLLLPKLISGEIRVRAAEKALEAAM